MQQSTYTYPATPINADEKVLKPSAAFKKNVLIVVAAILFFALVYLLLMVSVLALAATAGYFGVMVMLWFTRVYGILIGIGLIGLGIMLVFFMIKFFFNSNEADYSGLVEITEEEQPLLFDFIGKLAKETQTPLPKRIFLAADVNASVFYNSSFWSMFIPVRKNLQIGLGLVNSVNISEFKAVIAHEFGHFSQRSMTFGSYVYNVNKVIFDMLFNNEDYGAALNKWAEFSNIFVIFAHITVFLVTLIQKVLRGVYGVVNKAYRGLSRQMEFHADAVSAYVSGGNNLVTSLNRLEVANISYNQVLSTYTSWLGEGLRSKNLYADHSEVMKYVAARYHIPFQHGLPQVNAHSLANFNYSKLVIKDQWASHPSTPEREAQLNAAGIYMEPNHQSAWVLFNNAEALQTNMTNEVYKNVRFKKTPVLTDTSTFVERFTDEMEQSNFDNVFNGYYDDRSIAQIDTAAVLTDLDKVPNNLSLTELYNDENATLPKTIKGIGQDLQTLLNINNGNIKLKTFDYEGIKYERKQATMVVALLNQRLVTLKTKLEENDLSIYQYFYKLAQAQGKEQDWIAATQLLLTVQKETDADLELYNLVAAAALPIFKSSLSLEAASIAVNNVNKLEPEFRERIKQRLNEPEYANLLKFNQRDTLNNYANKELKYILGNKGYNQANLELLSKALETFVDFNFSKLVKVKKQWLALQMELAPKG